MHKVIYNSKLDHNCTLTLLDPRSPYVSPIYAKGHLSVSNTCPESYSCLSILCVLYLDADDAAGHLSVLCSVRQLPTHTMQCWAASNAYYLAFCVSDIVLVLFHDHIYQNYLVS